MNNTTVPEYRERMVRLKDKAAMVLARTSKLQEKQKTEKIDINKNVNFIFHGI